MKRLLVVPVINSKGKVWVLKDNTTIYGTFETKQLADNAKQARLHKLNTLFGDLK